MPLIAQLTSYEETRDGRSATRRTLRLHVPASASGGANQALVHNISEHGLLVECAMVLKVGDELVVELPEAGAMGAEVAWFRDGFVGCRFKAPISQAAISAGLLKSSPEGLQQFIQPAQPLAVRVDPNYEPIEYPEEGPWIRALTIASLLLALAVATLFILALLSFPFSNY